MEHPFQSYPALPTAHDGAVQEVLAHGGPQHPQQQAHQQEARVLPEGEARAIGTSLVVSQFFFFFSRVGCLGPCGPFFLLLWGVPLSPWGQPSFQYPCPPRRVRTLLLTALRRRRNRRKLRAAPWTRECWFKQQGARRVPRARPHNPPYRQSQPLETCRHRHCLPQRKTRRPCPC